MWFQPIAIAQGCDATTYARGLRMFLDQSVLCLERHALTDTDWLVSGEVQGSTRQPYEVEVELSLGGTATAPIQWRSRCTCPVGHLCKHAVALLVKAAYQVKPQKGSQPPPTTEAAEAQRAERERQQAQQAAQRQRVALINLAEQWLAAGADPAGTDRSRAATEGRGTQRAETPFYLLGFRHNDGLQPPLRLSLAASSLKVKGGWAKPKVVSAAYFKDEEQIYRSRPVELVAADHAALDFYGSLPSAASQYGYPLDTDRLLNGVAAPLLLEQAAATGRLCWQQPDGSIGAALAWGPPMVLNWEWVQLQGSQLEESVWQLQPRLPDQAASLCANKPQLFYLNQAAGVCGPVQANRAAHDLLRAPPLPQSLMLKHQAALFARLGDSAPVPPVLPRLRQVGGKPLCRLHLSKVTPDAQDMGDFEPSWVTAQLDFDYQGHPGWWSPSAPPQLMLESQGQRVWLTRDLEAERHALQQLQALGLVEWVDGIYALPPSLPPILWLDWAAEQFQPLRDAGFEISMDADLRLWVRDGGELQAQLQARDDQGQALDAATGVVASDLPHWFDLSLGLEVDGVRIDVLPWLPKLIHGLRNAAAGGVLEWPEMLYLPTPDGKGFVRVSSAPLQPWLDALLELFDERRTDFESGQLRLSRIDALRARMALGAGAVWGAVPQLEQLATQLQGQAALPPTPLPQGLRAELRPYQHQGLDWLQFLRTHGLGGILADDMGLGKTLQTLAHIQCEHEAGLLDRPVLVVAPVSLMGNWQREAARFCPQLTTLVLHGAERHDRADAMATANLVIAPYSLLHRDRERWLKQRWHLVVLDEAQNIKNAHTQAAQVVAELDTRHRLCLSGTPIENHLGEIWSLFHFLMPGFLGSQSKFQQRFRTPIEKHGDPERLAQLRSRLTPFILRRTKQLVAHELPPKVESVITVELEGKQANLYETIRLSMEKAVREAIDSKGLAKSQILFLDALLKLRQVCCDPRLVKTDAAAKVKQSAKLAQLMEMLPEMLQEGRRVLLFSQFTSMLALIEDELKKRQMAWVKLTGQTQKRDEVIERFTRGEVPLFLISLKAGGVGLNLPQADTVIHFDPWWNPAAENQATDRAHRIGQTQSVWVVKLVAQGTIEERILALQARKAELAREIYSGSVGRKQPTFTEDDVRELLRPID